MEQVFISVMSSIAVTLLAWLAKTMRDLVATNEAQKDGIRSILRNELVRLHRDLVEAQGWCTLEDKEYAERTYQSYHELGGNGTGTVLYEDIMKLPIRGGKSKGMIL